MGRRVLQRGPSGDVDFGSGEPGVSSGEDSRVDGCKEDAMDTGVFVYVYSQRGLALAGAACDLRCWLCYCCGRCMGALAAWQAYTKFMPPLCCSCCLRQVWRGQELPILYAILLGWLGHGHKQSFGCTHAALFLSCLRTAGSVTIRITTVLIAVFMRKVLVGQTGHSFDDTHVTAAQSYTT